MLLSLDDAADDAAFDVDLHRRVASTERYPRPMRIASAGRHTVVDWWTMVVAAVMMIRYWRGSERMEET